MADLSAVNVFRQPTSLTILSTSVLKLCLDYVSVWQLRSFTRKGQSFPWAQVHVMKTEGSGDTAPRILGTSWRWVVRSTLRPSLPTAPLRSPYVFKITHWRVALALIMAHDKLLPSNKSNTTHTITARVPKDTCSCYEAAYLFPDSTGNPTDRFSWKCTNILSMEISSILVFF